MKRRPQILSPSHSKTCWMLRIVAGTSWWDIVACLLRTLCRKLFRNHVRKWDLHVTVLYTFVFGGLVRGGWLLERSRRNEALKAYKLLGSEKGQL